MIFFSLADLIQDQRQILLSLMALRNRPLANYRIQELRDAGRKIFLIFDEGFLDICKGFWIEDEEDGIEGILELDEDIFWVFDDDSAVRFQRRFQGRKMRRGKDMANAKLKEKERMRRSPILQEEEKPQSSL